MEKKKRKSKVSIGEWIERCNKKHKNYYGYSKSIFEYLTDDVIIICPRHGEFIKKAHLHFKSGCNYCSKNKLLHIDEVKEKLSKNIYFDILPFENYIGNRQKIEVICKKNKHLSFKSISHLLINNVNCSYCTKNHKYSRDEWIDICNEVHKNKYDYSFSKYENTKSSVDIICPIHGKFKQISSIHKNGSGCKKCNKSIGENIISEILYNKNIKYEEQKTFNGLKYKLKLYFDFYLPEHNLCIEFDGVQHKKSYYFFGGEDALLERIKRDEIKNKYCSDNNINLLRMSYSINYINRDKVFSKIEEEINNVLYEI